MEMRALHLSVTSDSKSHCGVVLDSSIHFRTQSLRKKGVVTAICTGAGGCRYRCFRPIIEFQEIRGRKLVYINCPTS